MKISQRPATGQVQVHTQLPRRRSALVITWRLNVIFAIGRTAIISWPQRLVPFVMLNPSDEMASIYHRMIVEAYHVPFLTNCFAALACWLMLAGFIAYSGTYVSLADVQAKVDVLEGTKADEIVTTVVQNVPLVCLAIVYCTLGVAGMAYLGWTHKANYVWLVDRIIMCVPPLSLLLIG